MLRTEAGMTLHAAQPAPVMHVCMQSLHAHSLLLWLSVVSEHVVACGGQALQHILLRFDDQGSRSVQL